MAWFKSNKVETRIANILKGTSDPASSIGDNGQLYLKYYDYSNDYSFREYLEVTSSGPYINTGVACTSNAYFEVDFNFTGSDNDSRVFGCGHGGGAMFLIQKVNIAYLSAGLSNGAEAYQLSDANNRHKYKANADGIYVDDVLVDTNVHWDNALPQRHYNLFAIDWDGTAYYATNARVYSCRIWNGTQVIRHFIPAMRKSDDVVGMFDIVNGIFYTNSGSGSFTISSTETNIGNTIIDSFAKVNNQWQNLIGTDVDEITYTSKPPTKDISYLKWQITKTRSVPAGGCIQVAEFRLYQNAEKYVWSSNVSISSDMTGVSGETIDKLIDDNINTKFNTTDWGNVQENECNIIINLGETITLTNTSSYCFVTANDEISRDPVSWKLYSSVDGTNWGLLDERTDADIPTDRGRQTFNYPCKIGEGGRSVIEDYITNYFPCLLDGNYYAVFSKVANDEIYNGGRGGTRASSDPVFYFCCKTTNSFWGYGLIGLASASVQVTATTSYGDAVYYTQTTTNGNTVYLARLASMNGGQSSTIFKNGYLNIEIDGSQYVEQDGSTDLFDQTFIDAAYEALTALS